MPWILQHVLRAPSSGWVGAGNAFSYLQSVTVLGVDVPLPQEHCPVLAPALPLALPGPLGVLVQPDFAHLLAGDCVNPYVNFDPKEDFVFLSVAIVSIFCGSCIPPASCKGWREKYLTGC